MKLNIFLHKLNIVGNKHNSSELIEEQLTAVYEECQVNMWQHQSFSFRHNSPICTNSGANFTPHTYKLSFQFECVNEQTEFIENIA